MPKSIFATNYILMSYKGFGYTIYQYCLCNRLCNRRFDIIWY